MEEGREGAKNIDYNRMELRIWLVLTEHDAIFLRSCHKKITVIIFLRQPIRISASGTNLTNERLSW